MTPGHSPDPWSSLRQRTPARVALGRAGASLPTAEVLGFALDHAEARDAVHTPFRAAAIAFQLRDAGHVVVSVASEADSRAVYLRFPERGRRLTAGHYERLSVAAGDGCDICIILADGLSPEAVHRNGVAFISELLTRLNHLKIGPLVVARQARVAIVDEIGHALRAQVAVIVLGERPGLGTADSLGVYLVHAPGPGRTDADRNCVSNVRPAGLPLPAAADTVAYLIDASLSWRVSGVTLKDDRTPRLVPSPGTAGRGLG